MMFKRVLVLSPHTDDGELGSGGTLAKLIENGSHITFFVFTAPKKTVKEECKKSLSILGIKNFKIFNFKVRRFLKDRQEILEILYKYNQKNKPHLVLTPCRSDLHQDHQVITNEAMRAFKHSTILGYELPWNNIHFDENCFVPLKKEHVEKKIEALMSYKSQIGRRKYFEKDYLRSLVRTRGLQIGEKYAEAFEVIKLVLNNM